MKRFVSWTVAALLSSCTLVQKSTNHGLNDGRYRVLEKHQPSRSYYLQVTDDSLFLHALPLQTGKAAIRTISMAPFPDDSLSTPLLLLRRSVDLDLSTILFKYRFRRPSLPTQLNSNLNAAFYTGYRLDYFRFHDSNDPLGKRRREMNHFEIDMGFFAGISAVAINPSTTGGRVTDEYDGVVFQKGVAVFIGGSRFSIGAGLGFDGLLNPHRHDWIYQEKPYIGLLIGLNLGD